MARSLIDESYDPIYDQIRGILGEHFTNYCFIVMNEDGDLYFDYTNLPVGKMLIRETSEELNSDCIEIDWEDDQEIEDE